MNVMMDGGTMVTAVKGQHLEVWSFGGESGGDFIGISFRSIDRHATIHVTVDPLDPTGLRIYAYGNVSVD